MTTRERAAGNGILILPLDTGCHFSSEFVRIQAEAKLRNPLKIKAGMTAEDSRKQY
jgi:CTP-dependent riboflavin kinase